MNQDKTAEGNKQKAPKTPVFYSDDEDNMSDNLPESMPSISSSSKTI